MKMRCKYYNNNTRISRFFRKKMKCSKSARGPSRLFLLSPRAAPCFPASGRAKMHSPLRSSRSVLSQLDLSLAFIQLWVVFVPLHHFGLLSFDFLWYRATKTELALVFVFATFAATVGWALHAILCACHRIILRVISKELALGLVLLAGMGIFEAMRGARPVSPSV